MFITVIWFWLSCISSVWVDFFNCWLLYYHNTLLLLKLPSTLYICIAAKVVDLSVSFCWVYASPTGVFRITLLLELCSWLYSGRSCTVEISMCSKAVSNTVAETVPMCCCFLHSYFFSVVLISSCNCWIYRWQYMQNLQHDCKFCIYCQNLHHDTRIRAYGTIMR